MDLERCRKEAKALVRAFRAGDEFAAARAGAVLGARATERFQLSDAQHVVAVEHGYRTWPELMRVAAERQVKAVDTGLEYRPGEPVVLGVAYRRFPYVFDDGRAVELAGRPDGWRAVAKQIADERIVNISRGGVVSLPVVERGPGFDAIVERIAAASLALYNDLLDLDE